MSFGRGERRLANAHDLPHGGAVLYGHADGSPRRTQSAAAIVTRNPHRVDAAGSVIAASQACGSQQAHQALACGTWQPLRDSGGWPCAQACEPEMRIGSAWPPAAGALDHSRITAAERPEDVLSALHNIKTDRMLRKLDLFEELDRDKDELVTADEVVSYLRHHNVEVEVETVVRLFEAISHDASQEVVNLHDFSVALGRHSIAKFDTPGKRLSQRSRRPAPRVRSAKRASRALAKTHPATHTQASGMTLGESPPHQPPLSPVNGLPSFPPDLSARRSYSSSHTAAGSGLSHADARSAALQAQLFAATGENGLEELGDGAVASILARKHGAAVLMRSTFLRVQHRRLARAWRQWSAFVLQCRADKDVERKAQETVRPPLHAVAPAMAAFPVTCSPSLVCVPRCCGPLL